MKRKTKIVATIGPASCSRKMLERLLGAGMNVARLNCSHGSQRDHAAAIAAIREIAAAYQRPVAILLDLQGPKIRTGKLENGKPIQLKKGKTIQIATGKGIGSAQRIFTSYKRLPDDVAIGDRILLDDGLIELRVIAKTARRVECQVIRGGVLKENKGINLPMIAVSAPSLTAKDKKDLQFGIDAGVDYVALSFVRSGKDLKKIKNLIHRSKSDLPVIAKIEKPEAVVNLDEIIEVADGIMVARGDLGVEMQPEKVPNIQKAIIQKAIQANRPVITATQMLESMHHHPIPTRAEASDVANAIFDGTDAVMLSGETAVGSYPVESVRMMARIIGEAESSPFLNAPLRFGTKHFQSIPWAVADSAAHLLEKVDAKALAVFSVSGQTAKLISRHRPPRTVFAFTPSSTVHQRMALFWGVTPLMIPSHHDPQEIINSGERALLDQKRLRTKDLVVMITGLALKSGSTNLIKIHRLGCED